MAMARVNARYEASMLVKVSNYTIVRDTAINVVLKNDLYAIIDLELDLIKA